VITLLAVALAVLVIVVGPVAVPQYATVRVEVGSFRITVGGSYYNFPQVYEPLSIVVAVALLAVSAYLEYVVKIKVPRLAEVVAALSLFFALPLPYIFVVGSGDIAVVFSNYAKYMSLPVFAVALLLVVVERLALPQSRARVLMDLSTTIEKTEKA